MLEDPSLIDEVTKLIRQDKVPAGYAWQQVSEKYIKTLSSIGDDYLRERATDMRDVAGRVLDNLSGGIVVMVGGRDFRHSEYNRSVQGRRPLGTAFVPLLYAAAFEKGVFPGAVVQDWALDYRLVGIGGSSGVLGEWGEGGVKYILLKLILVFHRLAIYWAIRFSCTKRI